MATSSAVKAVQQGSMKEKAVISAEDFIELEITAETNPILTKLKNRLVGKLYSPKIFSAQFVQQTLAPVWSFTQQLRVTELKQCNTFIFTLTTPEECDRILYGKPWSVHRHLLVLKE